MLWCTYHLLYRTLYTMVLLSIAISLIKRQQTTNTAWHWSLYLTCVAHVLNYKNIFQKVSLTTLFSKHSFISDKRNKILVFLKYDQWIFLISFWQRLTLPMFTMPNDLFMRVNHLLLLKHCSIMMNSNSMKVNVVIVVYINSVYPFQ